MFGWGNFRGCWVCAAAVLVPSVALGAVQNGGFETGLSGWQRVGGVTATSPGAAYTPKSAQLGPASGVPCDGQSWQACGIGQAFSSTGTANQTFIRFDYRYLPQSGATTRAILFIDGPAGKKFAELVPTSNWVQAQVLYPARGNLTILFTYGKEGGGSLPASFRVDNVASKCSNNGYPVQMNYALNNITACTGDCGVLLELEQVVLMAVPAVSQWGLVILTLLLLTGAKLVRLKRATAGPV